MGMFVIAMSLGASFGFCFYIGLYFGDMHPAIPFLLLGIGVDDMFVIVQAVENLSASERKLPIHQRIGKAMRHAGVSITVTSVTDMAAFLIGSTSVRIEMRTHYTAIFFWSPPSFLCFAEYAHITSLLPLRRHGSLFSLCLCHHVFRRVSDAANEKMQGKNDSREECNLKHLIFLPSKNFFERIKDVINFGAKIQRKREVTLVTKETVYLVCNTRF